MKYLIFLVLFVAVTFNVNAQFKLNNAQTGLVSKTVIKEIKKGEQRPGAYNIDLQLDNYNKLVKEYANNADKKFISVYGVSKGSRTRENAQIAAKAYVLDYLREKYEGKFSLEENFIPTIESYKECKKCVADAKYDVIIVIVVEITN